MKLLICVLVLCKPFNRFAQGMALDDFVPKIQEAYRTAKNQKEIESVTAYCKEKVASFSFKERDALARRRSSYWKRKNLRRQMYSLSGSTISESWIKTWED